MSYYGHDILILTALIFYVIAFTGYLSITTHSLSYYSYHKIMIVIDIKYIPKHVSSIDILDVLIIKRLNK